MSSKDFNYKLYRFSSQKHSSLGLIMAGGEQEVFKCFSLEDEHREVKVPGKTRIPAGRYEIKLRAEGGLYQRKAKQWGCERGMLWLQDVPDFEWIYLHPANRHEDLEGCIATGNTLESNLPHVGEGFTGKSVAAFKNLYAEIIALLDSGKRVFIEVIDHA